MHSKNSGMTVYLVLLAVLLITRGLEAGEKPQTLDEYFKSFAQGEKTKTMMTDSWLSADKGYHVVGSMISTTFIGLLSRRGFGTNRKQSQYFAAGATFALGFTKEVYDAGKPDNRFSWKDLGADCAGILLGVLLLGVH